MAADRGAPTPRRAIQFAPTVQGMPPIGRRGARVQIQRYAQRFQGGPNLVVLGCIQAVSARSVDAVIDQRPGQPELSHAAFQLDRRPGRVLQRQGRKTAEPKGVISSFRRRFRLKSSRPTAVSPPWW